MKRIRYIGVGLGLVVVIIMMAIPVLAYDGMGGMSGESTIGTTTNHGYLVINNTASPHSEFDINSSSNFPASINQSTNLARTILPLLAIVSILVILIIGMAKLAGEGGMELLGAENPIIIIILLALVIIMAMAFIPSLMASLNNLL